MAQITFGNGDYGVDIGTYGGKPAVYITPNGKRGPVGERVPLEDQGDLDRTTLLDGETVMIFPTRERCKEVADALVGSKMGRWTYGTMQVLTADGEWGDPRKSFNGATIEWAQHEGKPVDMEAEKDFIAAHRREIDRSNADWAAIDAITKAALAGDAFLPSEAEKFGLTAYQLSVLRGDVPETHLPTETDDDDQQECRGKGAYAHVLSNEAFLALDAAAVKMVAQCSAADAEESKTR